MDSSLNAAARALARGDALGALKHVALRSDAPALALRGVAMAQLGEFARAKALLKRASRTLSSDAVVWRARCALATAEVEVASRELDSSEKPLDQAISVLLTHGDTINADYAALVRIRRCLLLGRVELAHAALRELALDKAPPALKALEYLLCAEVALRRMQPSEAKAALDAAFRAAFAAHIPTLLREVESARAALERPVARALVAGSEIVLRLDDVNSVLTSSDVVIDGCRRSVRKQASAVDLKTRPVLFALARELGRTAPAEVARDALIASVFLARRVTESHRVRLRVEIGRLRKLVSSMAELRATPNGYAWIARDRARTVLLLPPIEDDGAAVLALLADGEAWSTSALALALGKSQRSVQRVLRELDANGRTRSLGRARALRWLAPPISEFATTLLLPSALAPG